VATATSRSSDIFARCRDFYSNPGAARKLGYPTNPRLAQALGLYPYFIPIDRSEGTEVEIDGRRLVMLGSNNYLGLTTHPKVRAAALRAVDEYGPGCTGSRFLNGTLPLHVELEERLARFLGAERALVFGTGYQANLGAIAALMSDDGCVLMDRNVHASIIDGVKLGEAWRDSAHRFFRHNSPQHLDVLLQSWRTESGRLVVVDGVYSMDGDIAPLPEFGEVCRRHGVRLFVDDAHSIGVLGNGHGTARHFDCTDKVDIIMGTFSKSLASTGGFVAGSAEVVHWIQHFARPFIFSVSLAPSCVAAALASLEVIEREPDRVERVNRIAQDMRTELTSMGYDVGPSQTPIVPVVIGDQFRALQAWELLFRAGVYTNVALPPAVPANRSALRTSFIATHTDEQLHKVLEAFSAVRGRILT
jgi:8-amino-7-oxononanoate synthase